MGMGMCKCDDTNWDDERMRPRNQISRLQAQRRAEEEKKEQEASKRPSEPTRECALQPPSADEKEPVQRDHTWKFEVIMFTHDFMTNFLPSDAEAFDLLLKEKDKKEFSISLEELDINIDMAKRHFYTLQSSGLLVYKVEKIPLNENSPETKEAEHEVVGPAQILEADEVNSIKATETVDEKQVLIQILEDEVAIAAVKEKAVGKSKEAEKFSADGTTKIVEVAERGEMEEAKISDTEAETADVENAEEESKETERKLIILKAQKEVKAEDFKDSENQGIENETEDTSFDANEILESVGAFQKDQVLKEKIDDTADEAANVGDVEKSKETERESMPEAPKILEIEDFKDAEFQEIQNETTEAVEDSVEPVLETKADTNHQ